MQGRPFFSWAREAFYHPVFTYIETRQDELNSERIHVKFHPVSTSFLSTAITTSHIDAANRPSLCPSRSRPLGEEPYLVDGCWYPQAQVYLYQYGYSTLYPYVYLYYWPYAHLGQWQAAPLSTSHR